MYKRQTFTVAKVEEKPVQRYPAPPFTTSTLQQEAGRKLGMSVSQTMSVAQHLYEQGLITYMRTDSVNLSTLALAQCTRKRTANLVLTALSTLASLGYLIAFALRWQVW